MVQTLDKSILFDPFISPNPLASELKVEKLNPDYMFISHGHDDHIADAIAIAKQSNCTCIGSWETEGWFKAQGIENTHSMNIGGKWAFDFGVIKITNAVHSSSFSSGQAGGNPMGLCSSKRRNLFLLQRRHRLAYGYAIDSKKI